MKRQLSVKEWDSRSKRMSDNYEKAREYWGMSASFVKSILGQEWWNDAIETCSTAKLIECVMVSMMEIDEGKDKSC